MSTDFYITSILPYANIIIKICRAYSNSQEDFEDYYQEVCLQIWRSKDNFKGKSNWSTWIYRLSLNVCMTLAKKERKRKERSFYPNAIDQESIEENNVFSDKSLNQLYDAIRKLSEVDRAIILLYLDELSYQEIAKVIGTNTNNIGVRIKRIKNRLKKLLDGKNN
ncbi:RNA polymerase sigma factor [Aquimarina megaterium]|uniref:RNA polymerase sigma factor n=1 Tax=Aquimarina megaterium TaxID=1443666 RepID=UPI00046FD0C4|nr:sigma-70 family RNA polymerase sigma factor [Aquimarina megaterium]